MIINGNAVEVLEGLEAESVQCCVTSPPYYGLRNYEAGDFEIGNEPAVDDYVAQLVAVFGALRRVLKPDGTFFLNIGDTFKNKGLLGVPWRVAFALIDQGWILRNDCIWHKPNPMPSSAKDRFTVAHEYVFLFSLSAKHKFNQQLEAATYAGQKRGGSKNRYEQNSAGMDAKVYDTRNMRDVWTIRPASLSGAHFAVFPEELVEPCVLAGSDEGDSVLDPFSGSATTGVVARRLGREYVGIELNAEYAQLGRDRLTGLWKKKKPTDLQTWHKTYQLIAEALGTDDEPTIRNAYRILSEELDRLRAMTFEYNDALLSIAAKFDSAAPKRWLRKISLSECPDQLKGFDEAVAFVDDHPGLCNLILGNRSDDTETRLYDALGAGLRPIPNYQTDSIWEVLKR